jgi:hypothetical protein
MFEKLCNAFQLVGIYRKLKSNEKIFSFFSQQYRTGTRLDRYYVNNRMVGKMKLGALLDVPNTDHRAVTVMYKRSGTNQGAGYWKRNAAVLVDQYLKEDLKCLCVRLNGETTSKDTLWWERVKTYFRNIIYNTFY